jgi:hypothetical protein
MKSRLTVCWLLMRCLKWFGCWSLLKTFYDLLIYHACSYSLVTFLSFFCTSGIATEDGGSFCCYQASKRYDSSTESYIKSFLWLEDLNTYLVWILIYNSCLPVTFIHFPSFFDVSLVGAKNKNSQVIQATFHLL